MRTRNSSGRTSKESEFPTCERELLACYESSAEGRRPGKRREGTCWQRARSAAALCRTGLPGAGSRRLHTQRGRMAATAAEAAGAQQAADQDLLLELPFETLIEILSYLSVGELVVTAAACSTLREAVNADYIWRNLCVRCG